MKLILGLAFAAGLLVAGTTPTLAMIAPAPSAPHAHMVGVQEARDGCGRGWYRNRWGRCRPERDWGDDDWRGRHHHHHDW